MEKYENKNNLGKNERPAFAPEHNGWPIELEDGEAEMVAGKFTNLFEDTILNNFDKFKHDPETNQTVLELKLPAEDKSHWRIRLREKTEPSEYEASQLPSEQFEREIGIQKITPRGEENGEYMSYRLCDDETVRRLDSGDMYEYYRQKYELQQLDKYSDIGPEDTLSPEEIAHIETETGFRNQPAPFTEIEGVEAMITDPRTVPARFS